MNSWWRWRCMQRPMHGAVEHVERGEQRGGAVALVVVGHGAAAAGLDRQSGLGAVERLDLALLVDRQHHRMRRRIDIEADDVGQLVGEVRIARALEGADPVRLELVRLPDALHRAQRDADGLGHRAAGPVRRLVAAARRRSAPPRAPPSRRERRLAGLAGLVAQQPVHARLGEALLPAPDRRPADPGPTRYRRDASRSAESSTIRARCDVLLRPVAIGHDRLQPSAISGRHHETDGLCHGRSIPPAQVRVNPLYASVH